MKAGSKRMLREPPKKTTSGAYGRRSIWSALNERSDGTMRSDGQTGAAAPAGVTPKAAGGPDDETAGDDEGDGAREGGT